MSSHQNFTEIKNYLSFIAKPLFRLQRDKNCSQNNQIKARVLVNLRHILSTIGSKLRQTVNLPNSELKIQTSALTLTKTINWQIFLHSSKLLQCSSLMKWQIKCSVTKRDRPQRISPKEKRSAH